MTHALTGRKQTAEHVSKRMVAWQNSSAKGKTRARIIAMNKARAGLPMPYNQRLAIAAKLKGKQNCLGLKQSEERKLAQRARFRAHPELHPRYIDGRSFVEQTPRQIDMRRAEYRKWRVTVFERDNYTCQLCGLRGVELNADHIKPYSLYPELRYVAGNGRTLCVPCHLKQPTHGSRLRRSGAVEQCG